MIVFHHKYYLFLTGFFSGSISSEASDFLLNNKFSFKAGTSSKSSVSWTLDDVMTNNKTNKEHLIEVIYKDKSYGTTYDEIIKIKSLLKDFEGYNLVYYEVSFEYNDDGYIYKMIIK